MKKILMIAGVSFITGSVMAQKNTVLVYGQVGYENQKESNDDKTSRFNVSPGIGYQIDDNITVGIQGSVGSTKFDDSAPVVPDQKFSAIAVGPFVRYTKTLSNVFFLFGQLQGSYVYGKQKSGETTLAKTTGFSGNLFPAVGINVNKGLALNFDFGGIAYETNKIKGSSNEQSAFSANFGRQVNIGISKNF